MSTTLDVSVILITHNERHNLEACLASVRFCKEIIVVDHASTDGTPALARQLGCTVIETPDWPGFGVQKQRALAAATCAWVLSVDADERVSPQLQEAIERVVSGAGAETAHEVTNDAAHDAARNAAQNAACGYAINRQSYFLGHPMRYGGWSPDWIVRLFRRERARFDGALVHESIQVDGRVERLNGTLLHYSYPTMDDVLRKQMTYALLGASKKASSGASYGLLAAAVASLVVFVRVLIFKAGFLDGRFGWLAAFARAQETFWKYAATGFVRGSGLAPGSANSPDRRI